MSRRTKTDKRLLAIIHAARTRAKRAKRGPRAEYDLDDHVHDLSRRFAAARCEVTGLAFDLKAKRVRQWNSPSIDRIDSARGYTHDNVRFVLWAVNAAFADWGERTFALVATAYLYRRAQEQ